MFLLRNEHVLLCVLAKISFQDAGWCSCLAHSTYEAPCFPEWNRTRALLIAPALWRHNGSRIWLATDDDSLKEPRDREGHNIPAYLSVYTLANIQELTFFLLTDGDVVAVRRWFCSISLASDERLFFHNISKLQSLYTEFLTSDNNKHTHHKDTVRMLVSTMWWLLFAGWCPHVIHHAPYSWSTS